MSAETGLALIAKERKRQITQESWSAEHDDGHTDGALARAASCYAMTPKLREYTVPGFSNFFERYWPFEREYWKPTPDNRIRELVKAGALVAAEIDRLQRASLTPVPATESTDAKGEQTAHEINNQ